MLKYKMLFKWICWSALFLFVLVGTFFHLIHIPSHEKSLHNQLLQKAKITLEFYRPTLIDSLRKADDIALLRTMETIKKDPDFMYVRILSTESKVLAHDKIAEWGKIITDDLSQKIAVSETLLEVPIAGGFDLSLPLVADGKKLCSLSAGISREFLNKEMVFLNKQSNLNSLLIFTIGFVALALAFIIVVSLPLKKMRFAIESALLGHGNETVELKRNDELGEIGNLVNEIIAKKSTSPTDPQEQISEITGQSLFNPLTEELADISLIGILILDGEQHTLYGNKVAFDILKVQAEEFKGRHILEFINNVEFINLLKKSYSDPGKHFEEKLGNLDFQVKIITIGVLNTPSSSTIIYLDRRASA